EQREIAVPQRAENVRAHESGLREKRQFYPARRRRPATIEARNDQRSSRRRIASDPASRAFLSRAFVEQRLQRRARSQHALRPASRRAAARDRAAAGNIWTVRSR